MCVCVCARACACTAFTATRSSAGSVPPDLASMAWRRNAAAGISDHRGGPAGLCCVTHFVSRHNSNVSSQTQVWTALVGLGLSLAKQLQSNELQAFRHPWNLQRALHVLLACAPKSRVFPSLWCAVRCPEGTEFGNGLGIVSAFVSFVSVQTTCTRPREPLPCSPTCTPVGHQLGDGL